MQRYHERKAACLLEEMVGNMCQAGIALGRGCWTRMATLHALALLLQSAVGMNQAFAVMRCNYLCCRYGCMRIPVHYRPMRF